MKTKLTYRPNIDGLRAIAVVAVILYHAQITILGYQPFKGGFIGVDIFFVISGYLITSIILKELITTGTFSFKHFYERRVRRILPALLFVMLASLPFAWMYLPPSSFIDFSKSIIYSLGFGSNFYFHYSGQQYGAESGLLKPFLHTWSLSVEEQFYILFPIVLIIIFKYLRKYLIHILILGFIISLVLADWGSRNHSSFNFYILPTRSFELLTGSILAYYEINNGHRSENKRLNLILPTIGLLLIGHSIFFFNDKMFHPSFYTLSPIIGVCLIIWFSSQNELITKLLSTKLFTGIGLISYSLYLWHYPIFAFARLNEIFNQNFFFKLGFILLTCVLSIFSYFLVEKNFREKNKFKLSLIIIFFIFCFLFFFNYLVIKKKGFKNRGPSFLQQIDQSRNWDNLTNNDGLKCHAQTKCIFGEKFENKVFIIGDSHMGTLIHDLKKKLVKKNYQFRPLTGFYGIYIKGFDRKNNLTGIVNKDNIDELNQLLNKHPNSIIIFGGRFPLHFTGNNFYNKEFGVNEGKWKETYIKTGNYDTIKASFKNEITKLSKKNKIILIYPIPEVGFNVPSKLFTILPKNINQVKKFLLPQNYLTTSFKTYTERTKTSFELLDSIKGENIYRVYPHNLFCNTKIKNRCLTHDDKDIFYYDDNHLSLSGSQMLNNLIIKEIEKIEIESRYVE